MFHNLIVNGAHAMHGAGILNISVISVAPFCEIVIQDTGATAKRFIEVHHGRIAVDCSSSGGTTVTVQLPL